jgi:hypothetical protein
VFTCSSEYGHAGLRFTSRYVGAGRILAVVTAEPIPLFPVHRVDPVRFAASQHRIFANQNLRIGRSDTVHAVDFRDWINGLTLPSPACHQGWSGLGAAGELLATRHAVTCAKCRRLVGLAEQDQAGDELVLFTVTG